jgi:diguanylate cyclase (GGDEF)-like protein/PAS domain S-box-containing protein
MDNERILIVEDEKIIALDLQRRLERFGYTVCDMASDGLDAVHKARESKPDIILMDIMLAAMESGIDGIEAAKRIKDELRIPVIFLTAYADEKTLGRAKEAEPYGYILKPFKERELYSTIDIALYKNAVERKLIKQERLFHAILHSVQDGIVATDTKLELRFMNPVAEEIIGIPESAARGKSLKSLITVINGSNPHSIPLDEYSLGFERDLRIRDCVIKNSMGMSLIIEGVAAKIKENVEETDGFVFVLRDVTELKRMSAKIDYQASHDSLTGLSNREEFCFKLGELIKPTDHEPGNHVLMALDIDRFKVVNDTCGSMAGDELLKTVAGYIQSLIQKNDISARFGGDEFAIILKNCSVENSVNVAKRLQDAIHSHKFVWQNKPFPITISIGIVPLRGGVESVEGLLAAADDACYLSREEGGNRINIYQNTEVKFRQRRGEMEWITRINGALEHNSYRLYYQPIVPRDATSGMPTKLEILLRMIGEDGTVIKPADFIGAAERYNLMPKLDRWVVEHTIKSMRTLKEQGSELSDCIVCVNLSGMSILAEDLLEYIEDSFSSSGLDPRKFCFEITETSAIQNLSYASRFMKKLKNLGFTFSLDDFGAGFSSFGYLKNLPVDFLKIDGSFVKNIDENPVNYTMVESINSMGHVLGLKTIAEFVCSESVRRQLEKIKVDYLQGFHIAEPQPLLPD